MSPSSDPLKALVDNAQVQRVFQALTTADDRCWLVGGCVRDALIGAPVGDVDMATQALPETVMERARGAGFKAVPTGIAHGTITVVVDGRPIEYRITIPEGLTVDQAWERIANHPDLIGDMPQEKPMEGWLLANTISFPRDAQRSAIVAELVERQRVMVEEIWNTRQADLPIETIEEFVTLASIVEKETAVPEERPRVASVFINRLRQGMRLQSDPTIIYGIFGGAGKPPERPIYRSDIDTPTPYNTYTIDGLPPTPIANPGRASLEAVANPPETRDLFFVADGTGGHAFAETYEEHNANVRRWREIERQRGEAAENES